MKLVIVDDHVLFREGLAAIIRPEPDMEIVGQAGTVQEAIELARVLKPDMILMDFGLPDGTGPRPRPARRERPAPLTPHRPHRVQNAAVDRRVCPRESSSPRA